MASHARDPTFDTDRNYTRRSDDKPLISIDEMPFSARSYPLVDYESLHTGSDMEHLLYGSAVKGEPARSFRRTFRDWFDSCSGGIVRVGPSKVERKIPGKALRTISIMKFSRSVKSDFSR
jgi:hypothetical protein